MLRVTKIAVSGLTILGLLIGSTATSQAGQWGRVGYGAPQYGYQAQYQPVGNYGYPVQPVGQDEHPILKKVLIGGALVGIGFLAGRLTAPQPQYNYYPQPKYPQFPPTGHYPRPGHGHHRF